MNRRNQQTTIPEDYLCPITHEIMLDPVSTCDGQTYERKAIEDWLFNQNKNTSPLTNETLENKNLLPNVLAKKLILAFIKQQKPYFNRQIASAIQAGDNPTVLSLLKLGATLPANALHSAIIQSNTETVNLLIDKGADIEAVANISSNMHNPLEVDHRFHFIPIMNSTRLRS